MTDLHPTWHLRPDGWQGDSISLWQTGAAGYTQNPESLAWEQLPERLAQSTDGRLILWLPAHHVLALEVQVPAMTDSELRQRLPYAVEDALGDDLELEHVAAGSARRLDSGALQVAVRVARLSPLQASLQRLETLAVHLDAVYSEADALPPKPGDVQLWVEGEQAHLRHPDGRWLSSPLEALAANLTWWLAEPQTVSPHPAALGLQVIAPDPQRSRIEQALQDIGTRFAAIRWHMLPGPPLPWLTSRLDVTGAVDLLQGPLSNHRRRPQRWRTWRTPAVWAIACALLLGLIDVTLTQRHARLLAAGETAINDWMTTLREESATAGQTESSTALSTGLQLAVAVIDGSPNRVLQELTAEGSARLQMSIGVDSAAELERASMATLEGQWRALAAPLGWQLSEVRIEAAGWWLSFEPRTET